MYKKDLQEELKQSMLARDELKTSVLRMLLSTISYLETQKGGAGYEATEEDVMSSIQKEAKQRRDSIEEFKKAGRAELVEKEERELELLQKYLPEQLSEEEIKKFVEEAISATGASSMSDMGKLMGALMPKIKGKADGNLVNKIVKEVLA
ncbi:MAG: GatB/YqeY domain-containing protein [Patescibacteria group bacterium]